MKKRLDRYSSALTIHDPSNDVGKVVEMIDVVDIAGLDQQRDCCSLLGSASEAANNAFFRVNAIGRMDLSTILLPKSMLLSLMKS
ncbi:hypothetical protein M2427_008342 [Bradyrhizobium sp. BR13661]|nr:hypothetical protein [Bradyrhizobium sp. BR13661]